MVQCDSRSNNLWPGPIILFTDNSWPDTGNLLFKYTVCVSLINSSLHNTVAAHLYVKLPCEK